MNNKFMTYRISDDPVMAAAIHAGHKVRNDVKPYIKLDKKQRLREEDPYTNIYTRLFTSQLIINRSRFEVDVNRSKEKSIYLNPDDAWGLDVYKKPTPDQILKNSYSEYDHFYFKIKQLIEDIKNRHGLAIILDIHSYNHRRNGPDAPPADPVFNPDINIGTDDMNRELWDPVVEAMKYKFSAFDYFGKKLDVRENVKFEGGHFPRWIHHNFKNKACVISIEFKKDFMDEWTGEPYPEKIKANLQLLRKSLPEVKNQSTKVLKKLY